jgi:hypothetical protein
VGDEDRWAKLEEIMRRVVETALDARGLKAKTKVGFVKGKWIGITQEQKEAWAAAYGAVDLDAELRKAAAWIVSNPDLAPQSQHGRFLNTWFGKEQNKASIRSIPTRSEQPQTPPRKLCEYCDKVATGNANRIWACGEHFDKALQHEPVPMFKNPVVAKNVTGER